MIRKGLWKSRTLTTPVQGNKPELSSWEYNQHSEEALPVRGPHGTAHSATQTTQLTLAPSATFHKDWHVSGVQEGWQTSSACHSNSHHHKWPYLRSSPHPKRTLLWLLKIRSSEIHQQTYHHAVVLLLSRLLQNTAKEFKVIHILFYHMGKIFPARKGRHKMTDLKHNVTPTSKGSALGKKKNKTKQATELIYRSSLQL